MKYSLCESVTASSISPWCIRPLTETGKHLTGGVDTPSLCGRVREHYGWDLALDFLVYYTRCRRLPNTGKGVGRLCGRCLAIYQAITRGEYTL